MIVNTTNATYMNAIKYQIDIIWKCKIIFC